MRLVAATWVCTLLACSIDNPVFMVDSLTESTPVPATTGEPTTGTSATGITTTTTTGITTGAPQTSTTSDPSTGDTTHVTTGDTGDTGDTTTGTDSGGYVCELDKIEDPPDRRVFKISAGNVKTPVTDCMGMDSKYSGELVISDHALVVRGGQCFNGDETKLQIGDKFPISAADDVKVPCVHAKVYWQGVGDCVFTGMTIHNDENKLLYAAGFSQDFEQQFAAPLEFALSDRGCSCPDGVENCCGHEGPGNYSIRVDASDEIPPGMSDDIEYDGKKKLHNLQAYIEPDCSEVVDWFAEPFPG